MKFGKAHSDHGKHDICSEMFLTMCGLSTQKPHSTSLSFVASYYRCWKAKYFSSFSCSLEWPCNPNLGCEPQVEVYKRGFQEKKFSLDLLKKKESKQAHSLVPPFGLSPFSCLEYRHSGWRRSSRFVTWKTSQRNGTKGSQIFAILTYPCDISLSDFWVCKQKQKPICLNHFGWFAAQVNPVAQCWAKSSSPSSEFLFACFAILYSSITDLFFACLTFPLLWAPLGQGLSYHFGDPKLVPGT